VVAKDDMMDALLGACPTFEPSWREFLNEWQGESEDIPLLWLFN
jgi:hypothetical protein